MSVIDQEPLFNFFINLKKLKFKINFLKLLCNYAQKIEHNKHGNAS